MNLLTVRPFSPKVIRYTKFEHSFSTYAADKHTEKLTAEGKRKRRFV